MWLNEAGQSAVGSLVDFVITTHAQGPALAETAKAENRTVYEVLNERLAILEQNTLPGSLTAEFHVLPDFHGNRSPHADPTLKGMVSGLGLSATLDDLAKLYLATIQALAYGTRDIIRALNAKGYAIDTIFATGGGTKNPVFLREHANATGCRILLPQEPDAVLLGSAILGASPEMSMMTCAAPCRRWLVSVPRLLPMRVRNVITMQNFPFSSQCIRNSYVTAI